MNRLFAFLVLIILVASSCTSSTPPPAATDNPHGHDHIMPWDQAHRVPDRIALNWNGDPATSFSVTWRTHTGVDNARAQIAISSPSPKLEEISETVDALTETIDLGFIKNESATANFHSVTFTDLEPNTLYAYRVGDGDVWSSWYQTRTASPNADPFKFIYFGDAQNGLFSHWARNIRMAYTLAADAKFIIHAGDLVNRAHRNTEWGEWFEAAGWISGKLPSIPVPGNHEYQSFDGSRGNRQLSALWRPQFTLPMNGVEGLEETTYYIDYQGVRIVALDSNRMLEEQIPWLDKVLAENPHPWTLLTFHHPIFSSAGDRDNETLRKLWKPIIDKYNVDLVMQGHDHTYARGRAYNTKEGANVRDSYSGTVYVNSVSGAKMYDTSSDRWKSKGANMERAAEDTQLFQVVEIEGNTLSYKAYTASGDLYDAFKLEKNEGQQNQFTDLSSELGPERKK